MEPPKERQKTPRNKRQLNHLFSLIDTQLKPKEYPSFHQRKSVSISGLIKFDFLALFVFHLAVNL